MLILKYSESIMERRHDYYRENFRMNEL